MLAPGQSTSVCICSCIAHLLIDREYFKRWNLGRVHRVLLSRDGEATTVVRLC